MVHPSDAHCETSYAVYCSSFVRSPGASNVVCEGHYPAACTTARIAVYCISGACHLLCLLLPNAQKSVSVNCQVEAVVAEHFMHALLL